MPGPSSRPWSPTTSISAAREQLEVIFNRRTRGPIPQGAFKTKVVTRGVDVTVNAGV
jgi:hypothetical protein